MIKRIEKNKIRLRKHASRAQENKRYSRKATPKCF
jgi:hypothetical protein